MVRTRYDKYLKSVYSVKRTLENVDPNDPSALEKFAEEIKRHSHNIIGAQLHSEGRPFIMSVKQLDTTQPEDFGYGTPQWKEAHQKVEKKWRLYRKDLGHNLSHHRNLQYFVLGKSVLKNSDNFWGVIPEFSKLERRRCMFIKSTGMRCCNFGIGPICDYHAKLVKDVPHMSDKFLSAIKSETIKQAYLTHLRSGNYRDVRGEIALMRTMLDALLQRLEGTMAMNDVPIEMIAAVTSMCQKITETVDKSVMIEQKLQQRLSVEQVMSIVFKVMDNIMSICEPTHEQSIKLAEVIENIPFRTVAQVDDPSVYQIGLKLQTVEGHKHTTLQTKYNEDGTTIPEGISQDDVLREREWANSKFLPVKARMEAQLAQIERAKNETESQSPPASP